MLRSTDFLYGYVGDRRADARYRRYLCDRGEEMRLVCAELAGAAWVLSATGLIEPSVKSELLLG